MTCADCLHYPICMERRGQCREYKTIDMIRREIIDINNAYKAKAPACSRTNERTQRPAKALDRLTDSEDESSEGL